MTITTVEEMQQYPFDSYELTDEEVWAIVKPELKRTIKRPGDGPRGGSFEQHIISSL